MVVFHGKDVVFRGVPVFNSGTTIEATVILCSQNDSGMSQRTKVLLEGMVARILCKCFWGVQTWTTLIGEKKDNDSGRLWLFHASPLPISTDLYQWMIVDRSS